MCYSKEYSSSDGIPEFFRTGETSQLAACKTSYLMAGGSRKAKAKAKAKSKSKAKSKRSATAKAKVKRSKSKKKKGQTKKNITLY